MKERKVITREEFEEKMEAFHQEYGYREDEYMAYILTDIGDYTIEGEEDYEDDEE